MRCERGAGLGFDHRPGTVLYLCLEDSLSRIQGRLLQLTENAPAALHFATMAGNIGKGLEEQIEGFLQMYRDTVLVVIDTLQKVRISNSSANPYANDYQDLSSLKALVLLPVLHLWQEGEGVSARPIRSWNGTSRQPCWTT